MKYIRTTCQFISAWAIESKCHEIQKFFAKDFGDYSIKNKLATKGPYGSGISTTGLISMATIGTSTKTIGLVE